MRRLRSSPVTSRSSLGCSIHPLEQHRTGARPEPGGEHLAVVSQHVARHPIAAHGQPERVAHWPRRGPIDDHAETTNLEWSSMPDAIFASPPWRDRTPPLTPIAAQPPMHRLAGHPIAYRHISDRGPVVQDLQHRRVPLLHQPQFHKHKRPPPDLWARTNHREEGDNGQTADPEASGTY